MDREREIDNTKEMKSIEIENRSKLIERARNITHDANFVKRVDNQVVGHPRRRGDGRIVFPTANSIENEKNNICNVRYNEIQTLMNALQNETKKDLNEKEKSEIADLLNQLEKRGAEIAFSSIGIRYKTAPLTIEDLD